MATFTAQMLIGQKHSYDSGIINISHSLYLSENSRPAWILTPTDIFNEHKQAQPRITWIPTLENMLDDILLMVSYFILKDENISQELSKIDSKKLSFLEMYEDIDKETRLKLYKSNKDIIGGYKDLKLVFSIFKGSSLISAIEEIKNYGLDYELCVAG
jgi:hypothetical protein